MACFLKINPFKILLRDHPLRDIMILFTFFYLYAPEKKVKKKSMVLRPHQ